MDSDLMHPAGAGLAENDARFAIVRETFKLCLAVLAFGRHSTNADFIADHFDRFGAHDIATKKSINNKTLKLT